MQEVAIYNKVFRCPAYGIDVFVWSVSTTDSITVTHRSLYNRRSELVGASGTQAHPYDYAYSYDSIGNRLTSSDNFGFATYAANNLNQYTAVNRTIDQSVQSNNFTYDADGNLTQDDRFNYTYDDENRLVSVTPINPVYGDCAIENAYDHRNRRVKKIVKRHDGTSWNTAETHVFVWDGWNIVFEKIILADSTTRTIEYYWGNDLSGTEEGAGGVGGLLATRIDGVFYVPVYGANGNVMMYVDATGAIAARFDYDPYGRALAAPNYWENLWNFAFSTKYHDWETDLVAYQLRTYNPVYGRWLNRDPIEEAGGENLYAFCNNSCVRRYDSRGLYSISDVEKSLRDSNAPLLGRSVGGFVTTQGIFFRHDIECYSDTQIFDKWLEMERSSGTWWTSLPACPCRLCFKGGVPVNPDPSKWKNPTKGGRILRTYHPGGCFEMRSVPFGSHGNQCVYDEKGKLLIGPPSGGTVDWISPQWTSLWGHREHDVRTYEIAERLGRVSEYYSVRPSW